MIVVPKRVGDGMGGIWCVKALPPPSASDLTKVKDTYMYVCMGFSRCLSGYRSACYIYKNISLMPKNCLNIYVVKLYQYYTA